MSELVFDKNHIIKGGKDLVFSAFSFEQIVKNYIYTGAGRGKDNDEFGADMPSFVKSFYNTFADLGYPPTEDEFFNRYKKDNYDFCCMVNVVDLKSRALRAYSSILRDYHFYLMCIEDNFFEDVKYSIEGDLNGVDVKVKKGGVEFNVKLLINTDRAIEFKNKKFGRHPIIPNAIELLFNRRFTPERVDLYNIEDVERLKRRILGEPEPEPELSDWVKIMRKNKNIA